MKGTLITLLLFTLTCCKKESNQQPEIVNITYEVESATATGFGQLNIGIPHYDTRNPDGTYSTGTTAYAWKVSGVGTFDTTVQFQKGVVATEMFALHPNSNKWKIRIRNSDGQVLSEGAPTFFQTGAYSYYSSTIQATP